MTINLKDFESGKKYDGDYEADLRALQARLFRIQTGYIIQQKSAIIVFEGWEASGKGGSIRRLTAGLDPRFFRVSMLKEQDDRHFLRQFWKRLPAKRHIAIFDQSWYSRVLTERAEGRCSETEWNRAYDEINEFEAQQRDNGVTLVKIFLHIAHDVQAARLQQRRENIWKQWKLSTRVVNPVAYLNACHDMFKYTDTHWAPWTVIDANTKATTRISVLSALADSLEKNIG